MGIGPAGLGAASQHSRDPPGSVKSLTSAQGPTMERVFGAKWISDTIWEFDHKVQNQEIPARDQTRTRVTSFDFFSDVKPDSDECNDHQEDDNRIRQAVDKVE